MIDTNKNISFDNIIQWNINGLINNMDELKIILKNKSPFALAIQETNLLPQDSVQLNNYQVFRKDFTSGRIACDGVMILVHMSCHAQVVNIVHSDRIQAIAVRIVSNKIKQDFTLCSVYIRSDVTVQEADFSHLAAQLPQPFILCGDFNAHNCLWGSEKIDSRGKEIENFITLNDIFLCNSGVPTHLNNSFKTLSAIDLTMVSLSLATELSWSTFDDTCSSDHFPIILTFYLNEDYDSSQNDTIWLFNKSKWEDYQSSISFHMDSTCIPSFSGSNIDEVLTIINQNMLEAAHKAIPTFNMKPRRKYTPWWNNEIEQLIKSRKKCLRKYKKNPIPANFIEYKKLRSQVRLKIKESKKRSWINFMDTIKYNLDSRSMWDHMKKFKGKRTSCNIPAIRNKNGMQIKNQLEIADILADHYCDVSSNSKYIPSFQTYKRIKEKIPIVDPGSGHHPQLNLPFSLPELKYALTGCQSFACGPDNICYPMLTNLPDEALEYLLRVYNIIWLNGLFPDSWKASYIVPVLKPGKNPLEVASYRPIALMSCSCKIFEKMINRRLTWYLNTFHLISDFQSGSRKSRSTVDNLIMLESDICESIQSRQVTVAILLDIETAYNRVWGRKVLEKLAQWKLGGPLFQYIAHFLDNNHIIVKCGKKFKSGIRRIDNGIKQGSSLSCSIFSIATCDLAENLHPSVRHVMYVDDFCIYTSGLTTESVKTPLQESLKSLQSWTRVNGLDFSAAKTCGIVFSRCHKKNIRPPRLVFKERHINFVHSVKWLGIILDSRFSFNEHIKYTKTKGLRALNILKILSHQSWGLNRKLLLRLYQAYVRPILDYGCILYSSATDSTLSKLEPVQNAALRVITGAFRSSPVVSIQAESSQMPLKYRRKALLINYTAKMKCSPSNPVHDITFQRNLSSTNHIRIVDNKPLPLGDRIQKIDNFPIQRLKSVEIDSVAPPWVLTIPKVDFLFRHLKDSISPAECVQKFLQHQNNNRSYFPCFTDGSKSQDSTSCAFTYGSISYKVKLNPVCSIFSAEMFAIYYCLKFIHEAAQDIQDKIIIYSDSKSALESMQQFFPNNPICLNIRSLIQKLSQKGADIKFTWIPSHLGIAGNSRVDSAARAAHILYDQIYLLVTSDDIQSHYKNIPKKEWNNEWQSLPVSNKLRRIKDNVQFWASSSRHNRKEEVVISRLRIGHTALTHKHLLDREDSPMCSTCNIIITIKHILSDCPALEVYRKKVGFRSRCLKYILSDEKINVSKVIRFLRIAKLFSQI